MRGCIHLPSSPCSLDGSKLDFNVDIHVELGTGVFDENGNPVNNWIEPKGMVNIKPDSQMDRQR